MKKKLYFITGNPNKFADAAAVIPNLEMLDIDLPEIQEMDSRKIIEAKVKEACKHVDGEFIVEDTSLAISSLGGLPGPFIKWFLQAMGKDGLAQLAETSGANKATAKVVIGYAKNKDDIQFFEGTLKGRIVLPRGETSFGWDPIFVPDGYEQTFAEMGKEEKSKISMRRIALEKLKKELL